MKNRHSKKLLQISLGISALAPILTGLLGMAGIDNPIYMHFEKPRGLLLDSNLRFLNGLSVAIGIYPLFIIADITRKTGELRIICFAIFVGAIGRLLSIVSYGLPPFPFNFFVFFEAALPPIFVFWQSKIKTSAKND